MVLEAVMISRLVGFALEQMIKRNKKPEIPFSRLMRRATMILIIQNGKEYQAIISHNIIFANFPMFCLFMPAFSPHAMMCALNQLILSMYVCLLYFYLHKSRLV